MTIRVIGAGFGRTGTKSLKKALEILGFEKCYHMSELITIHPEHIDYWEKLLAAQEVDWIGLFDGYQAIVDFPGAYFYRELMEQYPQAKVILTLRDPDQWYESASETIARPKSDPERNSQSGRNPIYSDQQQYMMRIGQLSNAAWDDLFHGQFADKAYAISQFEIYNEEIKKNVPAEKLLVYEVTDGWEPLCNFLNRPIPKAQPFPNVNKRENFGQM